MLISCIGCLEFGSEYHILSFIAEEIKGLWSEYENNSSLEANLVKDFDKVYFFHILNFCDVFTCSESLLLERMYRLI